MRLITEELAWGNKLLLYKELLALVYKASSQTHECRLWMTASGDTYRWYSSCVLSDTPRDTSFNVATSSAIWRVLPVPEFGMVSFSPSISSNTASLSSRSVGSEVSMMFRTPK
jgi:hypothetical protein